MKHQRFSLTTLIAVAILAAAFATTAASAQGHDFHPMHSVRMPHMPPRQDMPYRAFPMPQTVIVIGGPPMMPPNMMRGWSGMGGPAMIPPPMCPPMMTGTQPPGMWSSMMPPPFPVVVMDMPEMPDVFEPDEDAGDQDIPITVSAPPTRLRRHREHKYAPPQVIEDESSTNADEVVRKLRDDRDSLVVDSDRGIDLLLQDAQSALQVQRWDEAERKALAAADESGASDRQKAESYVIVAVAQYMMGNSAKAKEYLKKAVKASPSGALPNASLLPTPLTDLYLQVRREELGR